MCCKCPILMKTRVLAHVFDHCTYLWEPSVIIFVAEEFKYKTLCFYFVVFWNCCYTMPVKLRKSRFSFKVQTSKYSFVFTILLITLHYIYRFLPSHWTLFIISKYIMILFKVCVIITYTYSNAMHDSNTYASTNYLMDALL